ncbi:unannotated protein [freshwater metagenome]|uniref:Unannotated protein n=1 Tax=freshwater metagenome TaxID=449393 RepID=A0A6J7IT46_9ZZZZ
MIGAGIPSEVPRIIRDLIDHKSTNISITVENATVKYSLKFDPSIIKGDKTIPLNRPTFLAIVSSHALAAYLNRDEEIRPDGFVIEASSAGGHNAPPRGSSPIGPDGQSQFSEKDEADISKVAAIGLPFWLAGGYATPLKLQQAIDQGAAGVQVGSIFALCTDSGITAELRLEILEKLSAHTLEIVTDPLVSPTSFPFKYANLDETISDAVNFHERVRLCDLGYLRTVVEKPDHRIAYRCAGEPDKTFEFKGGVPGATLGKKCLCNALLANIGMPQVRVSGYEELPLVTLGSDLTGELALVEQFGQGWSAAQAVEYLLNI